MRCVYSASVRLANLQHEDIQGGTVEVRMSLEHSSFVVNELWIGFVRMDRFGGLCIFRERNKLKVLYDPQSRRTNFRQFVAEVLR